MTWDTKYSSVVDPKSLNFQVPKTKCKSVPTKKCSDFPVYVPKKECKHFPKTVCLKDPVQVESIPFPQTSYSSPIPIIPDPD